MLLWAWGSAFGAPFTPTSDAQVLERLPARASDPRLRELTALRRQLTAQPQDLDLALRLAQRYYEEVAAEGDPRYIGYAQAALAPWWEVAEPPVQVRVMRAMLRQFGHQFDAAVQDLQAAVKVDPANAQAWSWLAAIAMVQARYADARVACERMAALTTPLIAVACRSQVEASTGHAAAAAAALSASLSSSDDADPAQQLWALTRLAEMQERRGQSVAAEAAYRRALKLGITDGYLLASYADFLLDHGRPAEVLSLLAGRERSDLLLLRLALAAKATGAPTLAVWSNDLAARFDAARLRGDSVHEKEEARFALAIQGQAQRAVQLAKRNFSVQREPADGRILLEAAIAAKDPEAAAPALKWLADAGLESASLRALADRIKEGR